MTAAQLTSHAYAEQFIAEEESVDAARRTGTELGAVPIGTGGGAALRLLAAAVGARHVIEIGTGAGTSGLWLLAGMPADGVLTSIEIEPEHALRAKRSFASAGIAAQRTRVITGRALDVLPRMNDASYDLVHIDADKQGYPDYVEHAIRLLRPGGVLAMDNMLWHDKVADPAVRDATTVLLRDLGKQLRDDERLIPSLLPVGDGLLAAVKR
ncbi:O-methyltransferase [Janibacter hoylei]|uniref:O-methyltransferase n=1 Tax=Janibacter hoylei PVAS-1 TaxID=1210046 RepID=K1E1R7_9MICO|nr:O-methyltransferase [Janibacter hoylei]EKA62800.1 O-methyltransferase [Janibacter hoylei PVAS-1]MCW4602461.1 O-methyltransferase [Janibacter hoylei]RWU82079.1 O-methyltransferase [Janibacter hoylei PVAS-1]